MGLVGLVAEIVVLGCIVGAIIANSYVVGTCDLLVLSLGKGSFGPWRLSDPTTTDGCTSWSKDDVDAGTYIVSTINNNFVY